MKFLVVLASILLIALVGEGISSRVSAVQQQLSSDEAEHVKVLSHKWSRDRQAVDQATSMVNAPAAAVIPQNKNFERNRRANVSPGERDPNLDTLDGRSAALERSVQSSRAPKPIEGFAYRAKFQNVSVKDLEIVFWEYEFTDPATPPVISRRQFLCAVALKPGKEKELKGFTLSGPSDVVTVDSLAKKSDNALKERVVINRIEFSDGTIWQRKGWHLTDVKLSYQRAVNSPWAPDTCKAL
jgi:hypothetical protein